MNKFFEKCKEELVYMSAGHIDAAGGTTHAFTTRYGGVSYGEFSSLNLGVNRGDKQGDVLKNYDIICTELGVSADRAALAVQVHGDEIKNITEQHAGSGIIKKADYKADALITAEPGIPLVVFTADCIPVLLYDPKARVIAAVHSGWRGTALGIVRETAAKMKQDFGCEAKSILAAIGPGIGACCFETDTDVPDTFYNVLGRGADEFIKKSGTKWTVDLKGINTYWLKSESLLSSNIAVCSDCTMCLSEKYWSHRKHGAMRGSQAAIITLFK